MNSCLWAILKLDIISTLRRPATLCIHLLFFLLLPLLPMLTLSASSSSFGSSGNIALVWSYFFLVCLLNIQNLWHSEHEKGQLEFLCFLPVSLPIFLAVRLCGIWLAHFLPLLIATPLLLLMMDTSWAQIISCLYALLIASPAMSSIIIMGAAMMLEIPATSTLLAILLFPLMIPLFLFGIAVSITIDTAFWEQAGFFFLSAFSLTVMVAGPMITAWIIRKSLAS